MINDDTKNMYILTFEINYMPNIIWTSYTP